VEKSKQSLKICIVTPLFALSGVPLAQVRFARALSNAGHDVDLVIGKIDSQYKLPDVGGARLCNLHKPDVKSMFFPLVRYIHGTTPDIIFSAEDHLNAIVLLAALTTRSKTKISCSSRVTPFDTYSNSLFTKRWVLKQVMRAVMWRADALTCVSKDMVKQYKQVFESPNHLCVYNIVDDRHSRKNLLEHVDDDWFANKQQPLLVAAGQLAPWKGFGDLIRAMDRLGPSIQARLVIFGDGPLKAELQELIDGLHLSTKVRLFGYVENPLKYFSRADVFVLSSHVEGLPNVLVEAMMCGCTPVATDCPTGPREVLQDGKYGYLVPVADPAALASGIEQALNSPIPKDLLSEAIRPFSEHAVIQRHFEVLGISSTSTVDNEKP